ncbi:MAG TPA: ABC transporter permease subunit [Accumulibacter sp.]|uniref:ABC transporter permease n=1 Tax=Accumulibacter sp. TaxID=2053492 RepID=UPI002D07F394|nr:ABC transporter permease subunit [Accumulibacter sp.]HMW64441.1 ABC transporter permease subunit [Accumulibacter sp.]
MTDHMMGPDRRKSSVPRIAGYLGLLAMPGVWLALSYLVGVPERYLPTPGSVIAAIFNLSDVLALHTGVTVARLCVGFVVGSASGVLVGILLYKHIMLNEFLLPTFQAMRALPPIAAIPFFLLWFGFSETGKILLIIFGVSINLAIVSYQMLREKPEPYVYSLHAAGIE